MKKLTILVTTALMATQVFAAPLSRGIREFALEVSYAPSAPTSRSVSAGASFGYFAAENLEIGICAGYSDGDSDSTWDAGVFAEYHINNRSPLIPFAGVSAKYYSAETSELVLTVLTRPEAEAMDVDPDADPANAVDPTSEEETTSDEPVTSITKNESDAVGLEACVGVKCFIARNVSLSAACVWAWANEDIYYDGEDAEASDQRIELGLRFYF